MTKNNRARTVAREIIRRVPVEDGDVILMKSDKTDLRTFNALRHALAVTGKEKCIIIVVDDFEDIVTVKESEMAGFGWQRIREDAILEVDVEEE